jgi:hypothetical protein
METSCEEATWLREHTVPFLEYKSTQTYTLFGISKEFM